MGTTGHLPPKLGARDHAVGTRCTQCTLFPLGTEAAYLGSSLLGSKILSFPFHWMWGTGSPSAWHWNMAVCPWYTVVGSGSSLKVT